MLEHLNPGERQAFDHIIAACSLHTGVKAVLVQGTAQGIVRFFLCPACRQAACAILDANFAADSAVLRSISDEGRGQER